MNSAIFFTLLALCAFQLVLADVFQDKINGYKAARGGEILKRINAGTSQQRKKTAYCQNLFTIPAQNMVERVCFPALAKCAQNVACKNIEVSTCNKQIQFIANNVHKCITEKSFQ